MIIGINGKIGSGKDTVGKIIQRLLYTNKDQSSEIKKFAGKLKQIASLLTSVPVERFEDQDFKQSYLGEQWAKTPVAPLSDATLFDKVDLNNLMTYRELLQKLGTEAMREGLHTNVWVNALFADYNATGYNYKGCENKVIQGEWEYPNWIITDRRFPNEMEAVKAKGGITIRVNRPYSTTGGNGIPATFSQTQFHPSETALDNHEFDYVIDNNGTISDLIDKVKNILTQEKLI
jgi:hypothetical protein